MTVDDPDGDNVSVNWTASAGQLTSPQGSTSMAWTAPASRETVTITATANDGKGGTRSVTRTIETATRKTNNFTGATVWTAAGSPYLLEPPGTNTTVEGGASLTIEAGVTVYIKPIMDWFVEGEMVGVGTSAQPIAFKLNTRNPEPGQWEGITGIPNNTTPRIDLTHVEIKHAVNAVFAISPTIVALKNCGVKFSLGPAIHHQSTGTLHVADCTITNNEGSGIQVDGTNLPAMVTIERDSITFNGDLFVAQPYAEGEAAISISLADPNATVPILIRDNVISINGYPGIRLGDPKKALPRPTFPVISGNNISGNERPKSNQIQIRLEPPFGGGNSPTIIDARNNYWGQEYPMPADSIQIKNGIIDRQDPGAGNIQVQVVVNPWLNIW